MKRSRLALPIAALSLAALFGVMRGLSDSHAEPREKAASVEARSGTNKQRQTAIRPSVPAEERIDTREKNTMGPRAKSLRGTDVDGALRVGPDGNLVLGPEILRLFEYFFTAEGEENEETIRARILAAIRERVDGPAATQAAALLDQWLAYRKGMASLELPAERTADPAARLEALRDMRRKHFGSETADALFGDEEREGEVALAESRVRQDQGLSEEEKADKLAELDEKLPPGARAAREASTLPIRARAEEEAMRLEGATGKDIHAYRETTFGADAADRLAALDEQRAAWKGRIEAFQKERDALVAKGLGPEALKEAEQALLDRSFTKLEQRRVRATLAMQTE